MKNISEWVFWALFGMVGALYINLVWTNVTSHDNDGIPCEAVGVYTMDSGAPVILRECQDGSIVVDYPYIGE